MISVGTPLEFYYDFPCTDIMCMYVYMYVLYIFELGNCGLVAGAQFNLLIAGSSSAPVCVCALL